MNIEWEDYRSGTALNLPRIFEDYYIPLLPAGQGAEEGLAFLRRIIRVHKITSRQVAAVALETAFNLCSLPPSHPQERIRQDHGTVNKPPKIF